MSYLATNDLPLSNDNQTFIDHQVATGVFRNRNEAIDAGIKLLRKRQELLDLLDERRRQIDNGEFVKLDQEGLRDFFDGPKQRARRASEA